MKALVVIFLLYPSIVVSQNTDSLYQRILQIETNQRNIQVNLTKAHNKFSIGTTLVIAGLGATFASIITDEPGQDADGNPQEPILLYIGSALLTVGTIIQIDSHKYIGRAGKRRRTNSP